MFIERFFQLLYKKLSELNRDLIFGYVRKFYLFSDCFVYLLIAKELKTKCKYPCKTSVKCIHVAINNKVKQQDFAQLHY